MHARSCGAPASRAFRVPFAVLAAAAVWLALAAATPAIASACSSAEFIGVRGSGESFSGSYGMGSTIAPLYNRVAARRPAGRTIQPYGLNYPAVSVSSWTAPLYFWSVWQGKMALEQRLHDDQRSCPGMRLVVGGFSQGAHVVGDALEELAGSHDGVLALIAGVAIYGDPRFNPDDRVTARGDYDRNHWGVLGKRNPYATQINRRLGDWCRLRDAVCQGFNAGDTAHHEYVAYLGGRFLDQGAALMAAGLGW